MEINTTQIINLGKFVIENGEEKVLFDCGPSVLKGVITQDIIPDNFKDNYKDIIQKSFNGYTDESINITGNFSHENFSTDNKFNIKISFTTKFYSFEKEIIIPLVAFNKDRVDYLEEKITQLTSKLKSMDLLLTEVIGMRLSTHKLHNESMKQEIKDSDSTDSSMDDLSDSDEEQQSKKKISKPVIKSSSKSKRT
jgi:hypothetical protein